MLKGDNISLVALEPSHADLLYKWENDTTIWNVSGTTVPFSKQALLDFINSSQDIFAARQLRLMMQSHAHNKAVGCIDLFEFEPLHLRAGVGILVANQEDRGKGYASEALQLLIEYAFQYLQLHQLFANVAENNVASINLFKKFEFEPIATKKEWLNNQGEWENEVMLQLLNKNG